MARQDILSETAGDEHCGNCSVTWHCCGEGSVFVRASQVPLDGFLQMRHSVMK
jgi:hypothetical protein